MATQVKPLVLHSQLGTVTTLYPHSGAKRMAIGTSTSGQLYSILMNQPEPIIFLGAGASLKSGIPLAGGVVEQAARWAFANENGWSTEDPRLVRSEWYPWLKAKPWFKDNVPLADNYHATIWNLLQPRQNRADFFLRLINPGVPPSSGYHKLAEILHRKLVRHVLTTNFDDMLPNAQRSIRRPHFIQPIKTDTDFGVISTSPPHPQLIYLHGSVEHYTDKNLLDEVQRLHQPLVDRVVPLLRDHPLIVIGYSGSEPSIMEHLLIEQASNAEGYRNGIYWCMLEGEARGEQRPYVQRLADTIGGNFRIVPIKGFDQLFVDDLWPRIVDSPTGNSGVGIGARVFSSSRPSPTYDMQPVATLTIDDLEWAVLRDRVANYCRALDIWVPEVPDRAWVEGQLIRQNLAVTADTGIIEPTVAGYLLFAIQPQDIIRFANVLLRISGPVSWIRQAMGDEANGELADPDAVFDSESDTMIDRVIAGNLWMQLDSLTDILALFNRPFRLKDVSGSATAFPYPALALKEVLVNALVHRSYDVDRCVIVEISPASIRIENPGGLVDEVRRRVGGESIEEEIRKGERGIKGYRNPVIADLFYGSGAMDKAGSGLSDVYRLMRENAGDVHFGPARDNQAFEVTLFSRPEAVDNITRTAAPVTVTTTRYAVNILEVLQLPKYIWHAESLARRGGEVFALAEADQLPPFEIWGGRLFSFFDPSIAVHGLASAISGPAESIDLDEWLSIEGEDNDRKLVRLLNIALRNHLQHLGLIVDLGRMRAYYPRTEDGPRHITYQARLRQARRTVVKARTKPKSTEVRYWEHKSLGFHFERFGDAWGLLFVPGYVFTWNGEYGLLAPERVNILSTRRAARDYNSSVHNDLVFWTRMLAGGDSRSFEMQMHPLSNAPDDDGEWPSIVVSAEIPAITVSDIGYIGDVHDATYYDHELDDLDEQLAELAEQERELASNDDENDELE